MGELNLSVEVSYPHESLVIGLLFHLHRFFLLVGLILDFLFEILLSFVDNFSDLTEKFSDFDDILFSYLVNIHKSLADVI